MDFGENAHNGINCHAVTFRDSSLLDTANLCPAVLIVNFLFIYCDVQFCMMVHF